MLTVLCGNGRNPLPGFQFIKPLIKSAFPAFIVINTYLRNHGAAIYQMAARAIGRLNFQPHIMGPVYFISHAAPPFFVVNPARTAIEPFLVLIL